MFQICQRLIDLLVAITLRDQAFELDAPLLRHLKHFVDVIGLPARHPGDGDFPGDEVTAADRERPAAQAADNRRRAAGPGRLNDLIRGLGVADRFEGFIDTARRSI